jgi:hypothetical protein
MVSGWVQEFIQEFDIIFFLSNSEKNGQFQWTVPEATIFYTDEIMTLIDSVCCRYVKILYGNKSIFHKQGIKGVIELFF